MRGPYPGELRVRVIRFVEGGGSRREAAEQFQVSASSAIRWVQLFREDGVCEPMPRGGSTSPLEKYSQQILALIREQRDFTLNEIVSVLQATYPWKPQRAFALLRSPWHHLQKKACGRQSASAPTWLAHADVGFANKAGLTLLASCSSTKRQSRPNGALNGWNPRGERLFADAPMSHWETVTFIAGLRQTGIVAPMLIKGAMNGEAFLAYVEQCLAPTLKRGDIAAVDNVPFHKCRCGGGDPGCWCKPPLLAAVFSGP